MLRTEQQPCPSSAHLHPVINTDFWGSAELRFAVLHLIHCVGRSESRHSTQTQAHREDDYAPQFSLTSFLSMAMHCLHQAHFRFNSYLSGMDVLHMQEQNSKGWELSKGTTTINLWQAQKSLRMGLNGLEFWRQHFGRSRAFQQKIREQRNEWGGQPKAFVLFQSTRLFLRLYST